MQVIIERIEDVKKSLMVVKENSTIYPTKMIEDLPWGLRQRMSLLLKKMHWVQEIYLNDNPTKAIFVGEPLQDIPATLSKCSRELRKEFIETTELLLWYLGKHVYCDPPVVGDIYCAHCSELLPPNPAIYCPSPLCPSHKMWRKIIGPSYQPPQEN